MTTLGGTLGGSPVRVVGGGDVKILTSTCVARRVALLARVEMF